MGKLSVKFMLRTVVVVVVGISALGWIMTRALESARPRASGTAPAASGSFLPMLPAPRRSASLASRRGRRHPSR